VSVNTWIKQLERLEVHPDVGAELDAVFYASCLSQCIAKKEEV
jgi:hypothetical protein